MKKVLSAFIVIIGLSSMAYAEDNAEIEEIIRAADQGLAKAQSYLGDLYYRGVLPQSYQKALQWYTKAAAQGYTEAEYNTGVMYNKGHGTPQDSQQALYWLTKAAEKGYAPAQLNLGQLYRGGNGIPQDFKKTYQWYLKAAKQGFGPAQYNLGLMYRKGEGMPQNHKKAYAWYNIATTSNEPMVEERAKIARNEIAARLTPEALLEAQALASEYYQKYIVDSSE